jgi:hypothetical protein
MIDKCPVRPFAPAIVVLLCTLLNAQDIPPRVNAQDVPPRVEIGAVLSSAKQYFIGDYHVGGGGRVTVNATRYLAGEVEVTRQPTGNFYVPAEVRTGLSLKGTYRVEQRRWLKFAGLNFFGVVGPDFLRRTIDVADPNPPQFCLRCTVQRRTTTTMLNYGGGLEVVPARLVAVRFDFTHGTLRELRPYSSFSSEEGRTYIKATVMLRLW